MCWYNAMWNRLTLFKHKFCAWLAVQDRLPTRSRICRFSGGHDMLCYVCGAAVEDAMHLLGSCCYATDLITILCHWLGINPMNKNVVRLLLWTFKSYKGSKVGNIS